MQPLRLTTLVTLLSLYGNLAEATELTFDISGFGDFSSMSPDYGDRVTSVTMGDFTYGAEGGFTPNVTVDYGPEGADPAFWTTGYGTLENILFEDRDSFGILEITFSADPGFEVHLQRWDMASFTSAFSQAPTIDKVQVIDGEGTVLFDESEAVIPHETFRRFEDTEGHFRASTLVLRFESGNLGNLSDDIAFDNIVFSQAVAEDGNGEPPAECGPPVRITFDPGHERFPVWDPRGGLIAFATDREPGEWNDIGGVAPDGSEERLLAKGPQTGFGLAAFSLAWVGTEGLLITTETVVFHEYLAFDVAQAPFTRTGSDGNDSAFTRKLLIDGGGGGGFFKVSRDGSTALWRFSDSGGGGRTTIRTAPYASLTGEAASSVGTVHVDIDTGEEQRFLQGAAIAPDGSFFILAQPAGAGLDLWLYTTDQSADPRSLTVSGTEDGAWNSFPEISPDGGKVIYRYWSGIEGETNEIFLLDLAGDGEPPANLTQTPSLSESWPTWSPDGNTIAFTRTDSEGSPGLMEGESPNTNVYTLCLTDENTGGGGPGEPGDGTLPEDTLIAESGNTIAYHRLTALEEDTPSQMEISADGSAIIYSTSSKRIYSMRADGSEHRLIFDYADLRGGCPCLAPYVAISHDGSRIAWTDTIDEIFTANVDGSDRREIATAVTFNDSTWEPEFSGNGIRFGSNGKLYYMIYMGRRGEGAGVSGIYESNPDGTGVRQLFSFLDLWPAVPKEAEQSVDPGDFDISDAGTRVILDVDLQDPSSFFGPGAFHPGPIITWNNGSFGVINANRVEMNTDVEMSGDGRVVAYQYSGEPDLFVNTFEGTAQRSLIQVEGFNNFDFRLNADGSLAVADTGGTGSSVLVTLLATDGSRRLDLMPRSWNFTPSLVRLSGAGSRLVWQTEWLSPVSDRGQVWTLDVNPVPLADGFPTIAEATFQPGFLQQDGSNTTVISASMTGAIEDTWFTGMVDGEIRPSSGGGIGRFSFGLFDHGMDNDPVAGDGRYHSDDVPAFRSPDLGTWTVRLGAQAGSRVTVFDAGGLRVIDGEPEEVRDGDGDGMVDLLEEAFGTDPAVPEPSSQPPAVTVMEGDDRFLGVEASVPEGGTVTPQNTYEGGGFIFIFEISENLVAWLPGGDDVVLTLGPSSRPGREALIARFTQSLLNATEDCYLRITVRRQP